MPRGGRDGVMRRSPDGGLSRLMQVRGEAVIVRAWPRSGSVRICAEAPSRETGATAVERMRFALGTDHDLPPR